MKTTDDVNESRRLFIVSAGGAILGAATLLGPMRALAAEGGEGIEITPSEDLMQEHGVLRRLLLIYDNVSGRLQKAQEFPLDILKEATGLIRRFVEDYHEKDEEEYLFTRFEKAGKMVELVKLLYQQHQAGRRLTARLEGLLTPNLFSQPTARIQVISYLNSFARMYRPHAAREDTVLYPAFRSIISPQDFKALGKAFEEKEETLFGKDGFEKIVGQVADLERKLGIYQLNQFTPQV